MKRFYIGCGESLQIHASSLLISDTTQPPNKGRNLSQRIRQALVRDKKHREGNR
jgi:hypothetical protein